MWRKIWNQPIPFTVNYFPNQRKLGWVPQLNASSFKGIKTLKINNQKNDHFNSEWFPQMAWSNFQVRIWSHVFRTKMSDCLCWDFLVGLLRLDLPTKFDVGNETGFGGWLFKEFQGVLPSQFDIMTRGEIWSEGKTNEDIFCLCSHHMKACLGFSGFKVSGQRGSGGLWAHQLFFFFFNEAD